MAKRVFYSNCMDEVKVQLVELVKQMQGEKTDKADLKLQDAGRQGYCKYIAPVLEPYCEKFHSKIRNHRELKVGLWDIYDKFGMGGFIRRNDTFGREELDFYGDDIRGVDRHCAYQYYLGTSCLHPEPLRLEQLQEGKKYVEWAVYWFHFKMKPQYKEIALFSHPGAKYVKYLTEGRNMAVGMPAVYWDFIQQFADFELIKKKDVYYFEDLGNILEASMKQFYADRESLTGEAKLACKAMGCSAVGYLALKPRDGNKNIPLINPIADYWVCARCQMGTLSMIKKVIDSGGKWFQSITDSVYWQGGIDYSQLELSNTYGAWDKAIKGEPWHFRSITSGHYGIADKDGKLLIAKFSGFGDDSVWCKMIKQYMKNQPLEKWHTMKTLKGLSDKVIQYLVEEAALNGSDLLNPMNKYEEMAENGQLYVCLDKKGAVCERILASYKSNMKENTQ